MSVVIAHRGASGYLPEHTLEAYALAIGLGADFIEPDLVATADGVLVARHENELSRSTDVALRREFADRRTRKRVDGVELDGWFSEDFTLAEIRTLRAREPRPELRPHGAAHDGRYGVPTFGEILALAREAGVGVYPETKSPTHFAAGRRLDGATIGISLGRELVATAQRHGFVDPERLWIQSFELGNLIELARDVLPAAGLALPLVQLFGRAGAVPFDLQSAHAPDPLHAALRAPTPYVLTRANFAAMRARYATAIGLPRELLTAPLLDDAHAAGLAVHAYTYRSEDFGSAEACVDAVAADFARGVAAVFIDQPDLGAAARDARPEGGAAANRGA